jgi:hypothetical protein
MLSRSEAQEIAERCINQHDSALDPEAFLETEHCFVFGWNSKAYLRTGSFEYALFGNSPIIVSKHDGSLVESGTAAPAEYCVKRYERRFKRPWWKFW